MGRYVSIWFPYLGTDWFALRSPERKNVPFVLRRMDRNRMIVAAVNAKAQRAGVQPGMVLADARVTIQELEVADEPDDLYPRLLRRLALWCIRFTPAASVDLPHGLILDATGCAHLWKGEEAYVRDIVDKLSARGYSIRVAMADTIGTAWAVARFGKRMMIIPPGEHIDALLSLPPQALRLEPTVVARLLKLGFRTVKSFISIKRQTLRRRFGIHFIDQLEKAIGHSIETIEPVVPLEVYQERLPCLEPILTRTGIEIALAQLLETLCARLKHDQQGLRVAAFNYYRIDGQSGEIRIGTNRASYSTTHIQRLFTPKLDSVAPGMGIELFTLTAPITEEVLPSQAAMWQSAGGIDDVEISELMDRIAARIGADAIIRYLPDEHHWPDKAFKITHSLQEKAIAEWPSGALRPFHVLTTPERVEVTAPIPDYPPMGFRHRGKLHTVAKADGPERIEPEWMQEGDYRDYYRVEDQEGRRYWLFRQGGYDVGNVQWFLHGFFA